MRPFTHLLRCWRMSLSFPNVSVTTWKISNIISIKSTIVPKLPPMRHLLRKVLQKSGNNSWLLPFGVGPPPQWAESGGEAVLIQFSDFTKEPMHDFNRLFCCNSCDCEFWPYIMYLLEYYHEKVHESDDKSLKMNLQWSSYKPQQMALQTKSQMKITLNWIIVNLTEFLLIPRVFLQHGLSFGLSAWVF